MEEADQKRFVTHSGPPTAGATYRTGLFNLPPQLLAKARERVIFMLTALATLFAFVAIIEGKGSVDR